MDIKEIADKFYLMGLKHSLDIATIAVNGDMDVINILTQEYLKAEEKAKNEN